MGIDFVTSLFLSLIVTFNTKEEVQQAYDVLREEAGQFIRCTARHIVHAWLH